MLDEDIKKDLLDHGKWGSRGAITVSRTDCPVGMDEKLATHFAHLFIRDPLTIFKETLEASPERLADHFEARENLFPVLTTLNCLKQLTSG